MVVLFVFRTVRRLMGLAVRLVFLIVGFVEYVDFGVSFVVTCDFNYI